MWRSIQTLSLSLLAVNCYYLLKRRLNVLNFFDIENRMAGIYLHIPFCARRCLYCDFYSDTDLRLKEDYTNALCREISLRKEYLHGETVSTIYFGGGTPSLLGKKDFEALFEAVYKNFSVAGEVEITIEANPDDLAPAYVEELRRLPFNRISIGIQSFHEPDLKFLNRRHTANQAVKSVRLCQEKGLHNISIDLMYGLPRQNLLQWEENIDQAIHLNVPHISAYHLVYEENTQLYRLMKEGNVIPVDEEASADMFFLLTEKLPGNGYQHYEISNFARPGSISRHNSSYWKGTPYIGLGAAAHSFNGRERSWNVASTGKYIKGVTAGSMDTETEKLDGKTRYNEYIITRMRTMWGINTDEIRLLFGDDYAAYTRSKIGLFVKKGLIVEENQRFYFSKTGFFVSDGIISEIMKI